MNHNPDIYLLYEYMEKISYTLRMKIRLDGEVDAPVLTEAAREAFTRFPYFAVQAGLDEGENYTLTPNPRPLAVLPEKDRRRVLGSEEVNGHLFYVSYRGDTVWFNGSHAPCGAFGLLFWVKAALYLYLTKKHGPLKAPADMKLPGTPIPEAELFFPDADSLPKDEPIVRYTGGNNNQVILRTLKYLLNPLARDSYYYEIEIPSRDFMEYAARIDGSPNTILTAMMYKAMTHLIKEKEGQHISGRIAADYRSDIGADESYRDFVRFIHVLFDWSMKEEPISKLNLRARGAVISQNQAELSCERYVKMDQIHKGIDAQPTLREKKKYANKYSAFRSDPRDNYTVSYVGRVDWGGMEEHIKSVHTITDGDLMLEVNALADKFCICFQLFGKDKAPLDRFLEVLGSEGVPCTVSERKVRYLPRIQLPTPAKKG